MQIREILLLHHSHTDVGYTHPQPVFWELQRRIVDQAIELCERTADRPEASRARWTCETTWPVMHWLSRASGSQIERFRALAKAGQMSIGALPLHLTPLANAPQFAHGLRAVKLLRDELNVPIRAAISNDINGLPWPVTNLLLDAGIETLLMGINIHSGGFPYQRPRWLNWHSPDGRPLLTYNGMHYNTFGRESRYAEGSTATMQDGIDAYLSRLEAAGHPSDFVMLTSTHPVYSDNYPPDPLLATMVGRWNAEERLPLIRFVTPESLLDHYHSQQVDPILNASGDWSDYWNFGAGSSATETRVNRGTARRLATAGMLATAESISTDTTSRSLEAWRNLLLYDEHTWGPDRTVQSINADPIDEQWILKAAHAWRARSLSGLLVRDSLEILCGNDNGGTGPLSVLCFNPSSVPRDSFIRVPKAWTDGTWRHCSSNLQRIEVDRDLWDNSDSFLAGPFHIESHSTVILPLDMLVPACPATGIRAGRNRIETNHHILTYDPVTGNVTGLLDKALAREFVDPDAAWPFFGFVHERPDPAHHDLETAELGRNAYYETHWDRLHSDGDCWHYEWKAERRGAGKLLSLSIEHEPDGISLVTCREAPGVRHDSGGTCPSDGFFGHLPGALIQRIKLCSLRPVIELSATFTKDECRRAESIYFAFPLDLPEWSANYDAAGVPTRWDEEQLEGSCKNWVTTGAWASVHNGSAGVTLATPDAPLVQFGDFGFGRPQGFARHRAKPLLIGWVLNNYWMTNFRPAQPGPIRVRYELTTHGAFDPLVSTRAAALAGSPVEIHPIMGKNAPAARTYLRISNPGVVPLQYAPCDDGGGELLLMLQNVTSETITSEVEFPGVNNCRVFRSNALGETRDLLGATPQFAISLPARATCILRINTEKSAASETSHPLLELWRHAP